MICQIDRLVEYPITLPVINLGPPAFTSDCCSEGIIGFENSNSALCTRVDSTCCLYGSYDNITSTTSSYVGNNYSDFLHDYGYGSYVNDTIRFANQTVTQFTLGTSDTFYALLHLWSGFWDLGTWRGVYK
jgi:hypothetical protein